MTQLAKWLFGIGVAILCLEFAVILGTIINSILVVISPSAEPLDQYLLLPPDLSLALLFIPSLLIIGCLLVAVWLAPRISGWLLVGIMILSLFAHGNFLEFVLFGFVLPPLYFFLGDFYALILRWVTALIWNRAPQWLAAAIMSDPDRIRVLLTFVSWCVPALFILIPTHLKHPLFLTPFPLNANDNGFIVRYLPKLSRGKDRG
jgi:hypothetical protein